VWFFLFSRVKGDRNNFLGLGKGHAVSFSLLSVCPHTRTTLRKRTNGAMVFCTECGASLGDGAAFCGQCGTKLGGGDAGSSSSSSGTAVPAAQRIGKPIPSNATANDWFDPYSVGRARAQDSAGIEEWTYDRGVVVCAEGSFRQRKYTWDGRNFTPENERDPRGVFDASNGSLKWFVKRRESFGGSGAAGEEILLHECKLGYLCCCFGWVDAKCPAGLF
jgi:zinc-ribbon domain